MRVDEHASIVPSASQTEANFDCSSTGITLQAMDSSHVSLVALFLRAEVWPLIDQQTELLMLYLQFHRASSSTGATGISRWASR